MEVKRLTDKNIDLRWNNRYYVKPSLFSENGMKAIDKLGQLEDIESEIGVDFITLHKALIDRIWYKLDNGELRHIKVSLERTEDGWILAECCPEHTNVAIQLYNPNHSYGIEWALTKEELSN